MHHHDLVSASSFSTAVTEEGAVYLIMILVSPPLNLQSRLTNQN